MSTNRQNPRHSLSKEVFKKVVPIVVRYLKKCKGEKKRVSNKDIRYYFLARQKNIYIGSQHFRTVIRHIRNNALIPCLIANSNGYYIATSRSEMQTHINSLKKRARTMLATADHEYAQLIEHWNDLTPYPKVARVAKPKKAAKKSKNKVRNAKSKSRSIPAGKKRKPAKKNSKVAKKPATKQRSEKWKFPRGPYPLP